MRTLVSASIVSVLCTVSVWAVTVPQLILSGEVVVDELFMVMVVVPTLIGLIAAVAGAVAGLLVLVRRRVRLWPGPLLLAVGQLATVGLGVTIIVWALGFPTTGWELLMLPTALMTGQLVVAGGLLAVWATRRRQAAVAG